MPEVSAAGPSNASATAGAARGRIAFLSALSGRSVALSLALAFVVGLGLSPIFYIPLPVLLGRTMFLAIVLLLAFTAAGQWQQRVVPRWVAQVLAVALTAPLATLLIYLMAVGGNVLEVFQVPARLAGFLWIAGTALVVGLLLALAALYRERDAQARSQALQFALERESLERQALDARLAQLQAQIEPHFLFNTLANVQALVESGSPRAAPVLQSLVAYLRAAMPRLQDHAATLGDEEALVRAYLELMLMRMPDRLAFRVDIAAELRAVPFPPMALLTLVENAVRHGIDPREAGGEIELGARREEAGAASRMRVWVADTGIGLHESWQPGTGLSNLRARLEGLYGPGAELRLGRNDGRGVRAEICIPLGRAEGPAT